MAIVYKRQNLYTNTWQRIQPFMQNPFMNIYEYTKFNFNPFSTSQYMARISDHYGKTWLMGDNSAIYRAGLLFFNSFCTFQDMAQTGIHYIKWLWGNNTVHIQGRIMVLVHCRSFHCHLYIKIQVVFQFLLYFPRYGPDRQHLWKNG